MSKEQTTTIRMGGEGGEGIISAGEILSLAAARCGWQVFSARTYPAEIKGGLAVYQFRISSGKVRSHGDQLDAAVCLTAEAWEECRTDLKPEAVVIFDPAEVVGLSEHNPNQYKLIAVPFTEIAKKQLGSIMVKNAVLTGLMGELLGLPQEVVTNAFTQKFGGKRNASEIIPLNVKAIAAGCDIGRAQEISLRAAGNPDGKRRLLMSGNQAMALGSLAAGCRYVAGYPITPATPVLELMARELPKFGSSFVQTEDEIAALASCIGASFTGARAMTATSGPGFALMSELVNLAIMTELPVVVIDVQRAGPSTGMPTKTEQSDLLYALYGSPGESPRAVIAPASVSEAFTMMNDAFNGAQLAQAPVIVLSDQSLGYRLETILQPDIAPLPAKQTSDSASGKFQRYQITESGVSPSGIPGTGAPVFLVGGLEHDENGQPDYTAANHERMAAKRERKLAIFEQLPSFAQSVEREGVPNGIGVIGWGSTCGVIAEAIEMINDQTGVTIGHFHPRWLNPFPVEQFLNWSKNLSQLIVVEENFSGQLEQWIAAKTKVTCQSLRKSAGVPFTANEIASGLETMCQLSMEVSRGETIRV